MELPIVFVLLMSFITTISSHPKNSDIIPKDYYKRQVLQPIPGYIPVYIKADEEPIVRAEIKKPVADVHTEKTSEPNEKDLAESVQKALQEKEDEKPGAKTEKGVKSSKKVSDEPQKKLEVKSK